MASAIALKLGEERLRALRPRLPCVPLLLELAERHVGRVEDELRRRMLRLDFMPAPGRVDEVNLDLVIVGHAAESYAFALPRARTAFPRARGL